MRTDKEIFKIFQGCPEFVAQLAGFPEGGAVRLESVTVKALERRMDGLVRPEDPAEPLTVVETQFQFSPTIYTRTVTEMSAIQEDNSMREVRGVIFFATRSLDPETRPWISSVTSVMLDEALDARENQDPNDPVVAVFKPVFESDTARLEKRAAGYYRSLRNSSALTHEQSETLAGVFTHWLLERLGNRSQKEIAMILDLPDIKETRAGRELIGEGIEKGIEKGFETGTEESILIIARKRFGDAAITPAIEDAVRELPTAALRTLLEDLLEFSDVAAFRERVASLV